MENDYYVYIYYRLDTNEPFYVGKGRKYRWCRLDRAYNEHFTRIVNKVPIVVVIEKEGLTENEAFYWEEEIIRQLVFEQGFSIDIPNNNSREKSYCHLCNMTWGGEGRSGHNPLDGKSKEEYPFYGKHHSEETRKRMSIAKKGKYKDEKHPRAESIICLTTKKIFLTVSKGAEYYNINRTNIIRCCKGFYMRKNKKYKTNSAGKLPDGTPLKWKYLVWNHGKKFRVKEVVR